jgi:heterodisulfide reductase subunit A
MTAPQRIGVYLCRREDAAEVDLKAVAEFAAPLPGVRLVAVLRAPEDLEPARLARQIRAEHLSGVVVAGESPGFFKDAFARALAEGGGDPERIRLASFREHGATGDGALERAKAIVACAVHDVPFGLAAEPPTARVSPATLVVGAGIAGIQASLEIADAGHEVHLVERTATIGGKMAMFDKTFPTLDCAACILTPKMVAVGKHPKIDLMVLSEIQEVTGEPGAYRVKVLRHASRVDASACVACNDCAQFCPVSVPNEFDVGIATRKAIYIPFPQAVPNAYVIDPAACTWVRSGGKKCGACAKKCSKEAVHLDAKDEVVELLVGNIVVATGYDPFDARRLPRYGYGELPNVLTALEFERLSNASGPTGGRIVLKTKKLDKKTKSERWAFEPDGPPPKAVAIIHCVGSRDRSFNPWCSRVCCMYSLKFAHLVREKLPGATCSEYYIDLRAYGKGYEDFLERVEEEDVHVVRGRTAEVVERDGRLLVRGEDVLARRLVEEPVDMVLLAVGLQPADATADLAGKLGIRRGGDGWLEELSSTLDPNGTERGGIFVAGTCQGPKDIPDTVAQASAAAGRVLRSLLGGSTPRGRATVSLADVDGRARALAPVELDGAARVTAPALT